MWKQKYGRSHRTWIGAKRTGTSGRCTKCTSLLSRVRKLPVELRYRILGSYKKGLGKRYAARKAGTLRLKKKKVYKKFNIWKKR